MPNPKSRTPVPQELIEDTLAGIRGAISRRLTKSGPLSLIGRHEIVGELAMGFDEFRQAIRENERDLVAESLYAIAASAVFGIASLQANDAAGKEAPKTDAQPASAPAKPAAVVPASAGTSRRIKGDTIAVRAASGGSFNVTVLSDGSCRACAASLYWCLTANGKKMPVSAQAQADGVYISHFSDCPQSEQFR